MSGSRLIVVPLLSIEFGNEEWIKERALVELGEKELLALGSEGDDNG